MAAYNPYRDRVNQKLYFAHLLATCSVDGHSDTRQNPHLELALLEGAALHLRRAYHLYLQEVADNYQCPVERVFDVASLNTTLSNLGKTPGEVQELINLEADAGSWLTQILTVLEGRVVLDASRAKPADVQSVNPSKESSIAAITLTDEVAPTLGVERVLAWHKAFSELIERQRELMVEC